MVKFFLVVIRLFLIISVGFEQQYSRNFKPVEILMLSRDWGAPPRPASHSCLEVLVHDPTCRSK
jgi:hypothetical protein